MPTGEQNRIDLLDLGRSLGELTAAVEANTAAHLANTSRIALLESQMAEFVAARKGIVWIGTAVGGVVGLFGGKLWELLAKHWSP